MGNLSWTRMPWWGKLLSSNECRDCSAHGLVHSISQLYKRVSCSCNISLLLFWLVLKMSFWDPVIFGIEKRDSTKVYLVQRLHLCALLDVLSLVNLLYIVSGNGLRIQNFVLGKTKILLNLLSMFFSFHLIKDACSFTWIVTKFCKNISYRFSFSLNYFIILCANSRTNYRYMLLHELEYYETLDLIKISFLCALYLYVYFLTRCSYGYHVISIGHLSILSMFPSFGSLKLGWN